MAEMGFTAMLVDEDDGGLGMGHVEAGIVLEENRPQPHPVALPHLVGAGRDCIEARFG